jgi:hypothetical protein
LAARKARSWIILSPETRSSGREAFSRSSPVRTVNAAGRSSSLDGKAILGFAWERSWNFHGGTNDYAEVNGKGLLSVRVILHPRTVSIETIRGTARF